MHGHARIYGNEAVKLQAAYNSRTVCGETVESVRITSTFAGGDVLVHHDGDIQEGALVWRTWIDRCDARYGTPTRLIDRPIESGGI